jgi:transcription elongation factor GreB
MNRPPSQRPTAYITREGQRALEEELRVLWKVTRPEVTRKVAEAAALGDRSENAEYIYGKRQLREIDSRIRFLTKRLDELTVVDRAPPDQSKAFFGAWVTLEHDDGTQTSYRIVGPDEIARAQGYISIDAPVARACLKKGVGDEVTVKSPDGERRFTIIEVRYE